MPVSLLMVLATWLSALRGEIIEVESRLHRRCSASTAGWESALRGGGFVGSGDAAAPGLPLHHLFLDVRRALRAEALAKEGRRGDFASPKLRPPSETQCHQVSGRNEDVVSE